VVLIGVILALVLPPGGGEPPASSTPPKTPTSSGPTTPPPDDTVTLNEADYVGKTPDEVKTALEALGLKVTITEGQVAPSEDQEGLVYLINPKGNVKKGATIEIRYYKDIPEVIVPAPSAPTVDTLGPYTTGQTIDVSFPTFDGCPVGQELSGYNFSVTGDGTGASVGAGDTTAQVTLGSATGDYTISYRAVCGGSFESPESAGVTVNAVV
jgi:eukaryotic-like serine/threonine-protein kinase